MCVCLHSYIQVYLYVSLVANIGKGNALPIQRRRRVPRCHVLARGTPIGLRSLWVIFAPMSRMVRKRACARWWCSTATATLHSGNAGRVGRKTLHFNAFANPGGRPSPTPFYRLCQSLLLPHLSLSLLLRVVAVALLKCTAGKRRRKHVGR